MSDVFGKQCFITRHGSIFLSLLNYSIYILEIVFALSNNENYETILYMNIFVVATIRL